MTRLRGFADFVVLAALALLAPAWCLISPASWERSLDQAARHVLFRRRPSREES